jgi:hypothetical protein
MTRRASPEAQIQRTVFQHLRARAAPGVFAFHPANGGFRRPVEAAILKGLGVVPGVPDVFIVHNGRCFALELKAEGGRATDKQARMHRSAARGWCLHRDRGRPRPRARLSRGVGHFARGRVVNVPIRRQQIRLDPLEVFVARAEARAMLWAAYEFDLHEAVDVLQHDAERDGLVDELGQDAVQAILSRAFRRVM